MTSSAIAELKALMADPGTREVIEGARRRDPQTEGSRRLLVLEAVARVVLREAGEEGKV